MFDEEKYKKAQKKLTKEILTNIMDSRTEEAHKNRIRGYMKMITPHIPKNAKIVDIGGRNGLMLDVLKENGYKNLMGIDLSEKGIEILKSKGYECEIMDAHVLNLKTKKDFFTMTHVLEHCHNPELVLERIYDRLYKKGGKVFLEVPLEPKPDSLPTKWGHYYTFQDDKDLLKLFKGKFELIDGLVDPNKKKWYRCIARRT